MENNTTFTTNVVTISPSNYHYFVNGSLAILGNSLILLILFLNINQMKKSAFLFGLALGDLVNGLALVSTSAQRIRFSNLPVSQMQVHPTYCMFTVTPLWIIGNQATSCMLLLFGIERFIAVKYYAWYRSSWTNKLSWICLISVYLFSFGSLCAAFIITSRDPSDVTTSINCYFIQVLGRDYNFYNYSVSIVAGFLANISSVLSVIICIRRMARVNDISHSSENRMHFKKQWQHTKGILCVTVLDLGFVVVPNILMYVISAFDVKESILGLPNTSTISPSLGCAKGALNLICWLVFSYDFRKATFLVIKKKPTVVTVKHQIRSKNVSYYPE